MPFNIILKLQTKCQDNQSHLHTDKMTFPSTLGLLLAFVACELVACSSHQIQLPTCPGNMVGPVSSACVFCMAPKALKSFKFEIFKLPLHKLYTGHVLQSVWEGWTSPHLCCGGTEPLGPSLAPGTTVRPTGCGWILATKNWFCLLGEALQGRWIKGPQ